MHAAIVKYLLAAGADPNSGHVNKYTSLALACQYGDIEISRICWMLAQTSILKWAAAIQSWLPLVGVDT